MAAEAAPVVRAGGPVFDEVIHAPVRLRVCGLLRAVEALSFVVLQETLDVTAVTLSKHLKVLVQAGVVLTDKSADAGRTDLRRVTWVRLTPAGRAAFDGHVEALRAITAPSAPPD